MSLWVPFWDSSFLPQSPKEYNTGQSGALNGSEVQAVVCFPIYKATTPVLHLHPPFLAGIESRTVSHTHSGLSVGVAAIKNHETI